MKKERIIELLLYYYRVENRLKTTTIYEYKLFYRHQCIVDVSPTCIIALFYFTLNSWGAIL